MTGFSNYILRCRLIALLWIQRFTKYILQHRRSALLITFLISFVPIISTLGIVIAALITLTTSIFEGAVFTLAATLSYPLILILASTKNGVFTSFPTWSLIGFSIAVMSNVLTWAFAVMLRKHASWSQILQVAALAGVLTVSVIHLAYPNVMDWWGVQLQEYYDKAATVSSVLKDAQVVTETVSNDAPAVSSAINEIAETKTKLINIVKYYATGLGVTITLLSALIQLALARWWQAIVFHPGGLRRELHSIRLSHLAGMLFILSLVLSYLENSVVLDIMPILYTLFIVAGLSLIHYLFGLMKPSAPLIRWIWLIIFYIIFAITIPASAIIVVLMALVDIWWDIGKRFRKI